ncbi:DNA/RNA helicase domain-containing protein [Myroides odoratus]|uniref:Uncharacterized conserved protein (DUF2075) n=1 Tax=Myroides odoratus TaxID=256 RepID=A0A378RIX1_MYROD|nr:DNA/RNA helicase domain-containing protein [Myroides odoratus]QQU02116.1 DUF2075 domain-containing protein [Myroides odoratus]STZ26983.1 Uncharacterized conserved protein (DUF2075) [Myroides odoratus]
MNPNFVIINGKHPYLDYEELEQSFNETLWLHCRESKVFVINNLPVAVSTEIDIDVIIVVNVLNVEGNYYVLKYQSDSKKYLHNQIIPITFIKGLENRNISIENDNLLVDDEIELDYTSEINSVRYGLINYLTNHCGLDQQGLYVNPVVHIDNSANIYKDNYIVSKTLNFRDIIRYFQDSYLSIFSANFNWCKPEFYYDVELILNRIVEKASIDSETGFLTKKKVDRITKQLASTKMIFDELGKQMVIITGKAGTGKSSELLLLAIKCMSNGLNSIYLTYNKLLVYDITKMIRDQRNRLVKANEVLNADQINTKVGICTTDTLHSYFYALSKDLGVLHILGEHRINMLLDLLKKRLNSIYLFIQSYYLQDSVSLSSIKHFIQSTKSLDTPTKEVGIDLINYIIKKKIDRNNKLVDTTRAFFSYKSKLVSNLEIKDVFLSDYYGVLENVLLQIQDPANFYHKFNVGDKYELLEIVYKLKPQDNSHSLLSMKEFDRVHKRKISGKRRKTNVFIDEAQDCHRLEKDILIELFGSEKIVIANGGKEQLIRHAEVCNWEVSQGKPIGFKKHNTYNKSFRMKKSSVDLCNYVAKHYGIDLNLVTIESDDVGEVILDFRRNIQASKIEPIFSHLLTKGKITGCTAYESLMILVDSHSQLVSRDLESDQNRHLEEEEDRTQNIVINEYGNIEEKASRRNNQWAFKDYFVSNSGKDMFFWDGTIADKRTLSIPTSLENRLLYYESCRGLESWSVACFALDRFFDYKKMDIEAENFLLDDLFLSHDTELRKSMYAATWILMALTRVIDTLYIQIENPTSELANVLMRYAESNKTSSNIRILKD